MTRDRCAPILRWLCVRGLKVIASGLMVVMLVVLLVVVVVDGDSVSKDVRLKPICSRLN